MPETDNGRVQVDPNGAENKQSSACKPIYYVRSGGQRWNVTVLASATEERTARVGIPGARIFKDPESGLSVLLPPSFVPGSPIDGPFVLPCSVAPRASGEGRRNGRE
ncbi:hypothetical protein HYW42_03590 [Candidatus Daviesbacteria bacterium]|nr:hypothetical protein [Candidatus Daviesbacteria bacterium]